MNLEMIPIEIIGLKRDLMPLIETLRVAGCVHIDRVADMPDVLARPLTLNAQISQRQEELSLLSARNDGLIEVLGCYKHNHTTKTTAEAGRDLLAAREEINALLPKVQALTRRRDDLESELASLPLYENTLRKLLPLVPAAAHNPENTVVGVLVNNANIAVLETVGKQVLEMTMGVATVISSEVDESTEAMLIVIPKMYESEIESILGQSDVSRLRMPPGMGNGLPAAVLAMIHQRLQDIPPQVKQIEMELNGLSEQWCCKLHAWQKILQEELDGYQVLSKFGETETTFVLTGWAPKRDLQDVKNRLEACIGEALLVREMPFTPALKERAPIILENPTPAKPFESLVRMLELPRYNHFDPTMITAFFMPIFFGLMLGDIGYGLIIFLASLILIRKFHKGTLHDLVMVIATGSVWAMVFGVLYGELFGTLGEAVGLHPIWMARDSAEDVESLLLLSIAIGAGHVTLGLLIGLWEAVKDRSRTHLLERGGMLIGLIGLFFMVGVLQNMLPAGFMTPAVAAIIVGIVLLSASMGWIGVAIGWIEFIGLIGNILSYLRIAALGLASVYLAKVANNMVGIAGNIVVGLMIAVLIHAFNLAMGVFSPTIHSLRLHYVEFYRKFYVGGGRAYEPFRSRSA